MDSSPHRDAAQKSGTPRDPPRESSDDKSIIDHELEEARKATLEANRCFLALQRRSHEKATPPALPRRLLRRDLHHLTGSKKDEKMDDHLEKAMENYEELC